MNSTQNSTDFQQVNNQTNTSTNICSDTPSFSFGKGLTGSQAMELPSQQPKDQIKDFKITTSGIVSSFSDERAGTVSASTSLLNNKSLTHQTIKVLLEYQWSDQRDLIPNVKCQIEQSTDLQWSRSDSATKSGNIYLLSLLENIRSCGFLLYNTSKNIALSYYHPSEKLYVFIAPLSQIDNQTKIELSEALSDGKLILKVRDLSPENHTQSIATTSSVNVMSKAVTPNAGSSAFVPNIRQAQEPMQADQKTISQLNQACEEVFAMGNSSKQRLQSRHQQSSTSNSIKDNNKRTKERQIKFVVEKVTLWRKLYNGVDLGSGEIVRYSLEDAARLVNISKKSLDDYLLQLRFGRMFGFNFLKYQNDNIGQLRKFVREHKDKSRKSKNQPSSQPNKIQLSVEPQLPQANTFTLFRECDLNNEEKADIIMMSNDEMGVNTSNRGSISLTTTSNSPDTQK